MRYGSVCSGIEAASVAWHPLGWRTSFLSEIEAFPRAVLSHHYPNVPLHGDFTTIQAGQYEPIDLLVGGTPCQSFSIAGLRGGLADKRGSLALEYLRLADRLRPRWVLWENVPGVLSSNGGRDFGAFLGGLVECGYGFAYRVLDAQYFGLAQRRKRVFVVGYLGDWRRAAAVLFERESMRGNPPPRREKGERVAPTISSRPTGGGGLGTDFDLDGGLISKCLNAHGGSGRSGRSDAESETFVVTPLLASGAHGSNGAGIGQLGDPAMTLDTTGAMAVAFSCKDHGADAGALAPTLRAMGHSGSHANAGGQLAVAFQVGNLARGAGAAPSGEVFPTLKSDHGRGTSAQAHCAMATSAVRRLTPRECCRLQGFPDNYLDITYRGKPAADGPKYKALGNSMAVPVMRWIGNRMAMQEAAIFREVA